MNCLGVSTNSCQFSRVYNDLLRFIKRNLATEKRYNTQECKNELRYKRKTGKWQTSCIRNTVGWGTRGDTISYRVEFSNISCYSQNVEMMMLFSVWNNHTKYTVSISSTSRKNSHGHWGQVFLELYSNLSDHGDGIIMKRKIFY